MLGKALIPAWGAGEGSWQLWLLGCHCVQKPALEMECVGMGPGQPSGPGDGCGGSNDELLRDLRRGAMTNLHC